MSASVDELLAKFEAEGVRPALCTEHAATTTAMASGPTALRFAILMSLSVRGGRHAAADPRGATQAAA